MENFSQLKPLVSVEWLRDHLNDKNLIIFDARMSKVTASEAVSENSQIPNAKFFDIKNIFSNTSAPFPNTVPSEEQFTKESQKFGINTDSIIVVYDEKGINSSARVWFLYKAFGHKNVAVLDGGIPEWKKQNYPTVERSISTSVPSLGNFQGIFNQNYFKFFNDIKLLSNDDSCLILDARSSSRFFGSIPEPRKGLRSGHIPNSVNLPFGDLIDGNCMKSRKELKSIFKALDLSNKKLVFSCGSGITACILALAAEISGYNDISVYDGSWTEYGTLTTH